MQSMTIPRNRFLFFVIMLFAVFFSCGNSRRAMTTDSRPMEGRAAVDASTTPDAAHVASEADPTAPQARLQLDETPEATLGIHW